MAMRYGLEPCAARHGSAAGARRSRSRQRPAALRDRRLARSRREGKQGSRARRDRQLRLRDAGRAHHRQPVAGGSAARKAVRFDLPIALGILLASEQVCSRRLDELRVVRRAVARRRDQARARRAARGNRGGARRSSHDRAADQRRRRRAGVGLRRSLSRSICSMSSAHATGASALSFVDGAAPPARRVRNIST